MRRAEFHKAESHHQGELGKGRRREAKIHRAMHKAAGMSEDQDSPHAQLASECEKAAELHEAHQALHAECAKSAAAADLVKSQQLEPTQISAVTPTRPNITPVLRYGQRPIEEAARLDPRLSKIVGADVGSLDGEEEPSLLR
jgi:hypothetical protein